MFIIIVVVNNNNCFSVIKISPVYGALQFAKYFPILDHSDPVSWGEIVILVIC